MDGQETLSVEQSETLQQLQQRNETLPAGNQVAEPEPVPVEPQAAAPTEPVSEVSTDGDTFEYDGQVFATEKEAFEYMKGRVGELETERLLDEARMEGRQEALQYIPQFAGQPAPAVEAEPEVDMDKFYENPGEFLKQYGNKIYDKVKTELTQAQQAQLQQQELWNTFANKYPDLADFREDVDYVASQHSETIRALASRNQTKAMDYVATKTREKFQRYMEARKPTRTLANTKAGPSVGGNPTVTSTTNNASSEKKVDFASQLRQRKYR